MNISRVNSNHCLNAPKRNSKTVFCHRLATHFEDLSNELLLDIFDFLDGYHIFEAFSNLNNRIQHLVTSSYFLLKLNISFMSKSNFNRRSINIIRPYMNRIISLQLSETFFIKNFFTSFPVDTSFNRLESLILNHLNIDHSGPILISLAQLPRLFSFTIFCYECNELFIIFQSIFRLPVLRYAQILCSNWGSRFLFPLATSDSQRNADGNSRCRTLLDEFSSPFWIERQLFFAHSHYYQFSQEVHLAFYSTQMRRRYCCQIDGPLDNNICLYQDPVFYLSSGPGISMKNRNIVANFPFQFPYVTALELIDNYYTINIDSFIDNLSHIIILTNITYLKIPFNNQLLNNFVKLLNRMPNVQKLILDVRPSSEMEVSSDQQTNTADLVCNNNVQNVIITDKLALTTVQLINKLFPRMECLEIQSRGDALISFVQTLLSNRISNNHLFSLMFYGDNAMINQLITMIDNEKLLDNYNIERRWLELCLWW
ncbi:unnamed protein product [Adineta steineri]|uniref:F-box domain-containing protein n=1 Tax=Adineta steineri TaxID=433720 RepID=A0A815XCY9_9BILA|nr:unnamed protein product [Adineta steineri]CAF1555988.1 unnamed protein product [Adineta steineri]